MIYVTIRFFSVEVGHEAYLSNFWWFWMDCQINHHQFAKKSVLYRLDMCIILSNGNFYQIVMSSVMNCYWSLCCLHKMHIHVSHCNMVYVNFALYQNKVFLVKILIEWIDRCTTETQSHFIFLQTICFLLFTAVKPMRENSCSPSSLCSIQINYYIGRRAVLNYSGETRLFNRINVLM